VRRKHILIHFQTVTFAVHDLCLHPSYVAPIRAELESAQYKAFEQSGVGLPLLDSFIKESARLTPVESSKCLIASRSCSANSTVSTRRHALKPFTLADGTKLHPGDWACTPVKAMMQSATHYPSPLDFQGFRFVDPRVLSAVKGEVRQPEPSKLTDPGNTFHVWGTGRMVW
jgi:cytochrome P450